MTKELRQEWRRRSLAALCWFVAVELFVFAPFKFYPGGVFGYPSYPEKFARWGYPSWFSFVVGGLEILAAVLLVHPRRRFLGAVILLFVLTGGVTTHIINHDSISDSVAAPVHLVLAAIVALATWPRDWRDPLIPGEWRSRTARMASQGS